MAEGGSSGLPRLKQCLIRRTGQQELHGVAASSIKQLKAKACKLLAIDCASQPITLVLAEDGTIIDDEDYFLYLPQNTKFGVVAKNEKWTSTGDGTTWLEEEMTNTDEMDSSGENWKVLARQLKYDLSTIILMSEEDLQALIDVPCLDLAWELSDSLLQTQRLQAALQETLDRREEERRSRQLLELYLQAIEKKKLATSTAQAPEADEKSSRKTDTVDMGSSGPSSLKRTGLNTHILSVLKEETVPELSLSSQDLDLVCKKDTQVLSQALSWDKGKTEALKEACEQELSRRLQSFQSQDSLRSISKEADEKSSGGTDTVDMGSSGPSAVEMTGLTPRILSVLEKKRAPELSLDLQHLVLVCKEDSEVLSQALSWDKKKTEALMEACRQELSMRMQILESQDSLRSISKEADEKCSGGTDTVDMGSSGPGSVKRTGLNTRVLSVLEKKRAPELSLSSQDLELVCKEDSKVLSRALSWDKGKTEDLKEACEQELSRRLQSINSLESLRSISQRKRKQPEFGERSSSKRGK